MTVTDGDLRFVDTGEQCGKARRVCQKDAVPHILAKLSAGLTFRKWRRGEPAPPCAPQKPLQGAICMTSGADPVVPAIVPKNSVRRPCFVRSEEHTSELQSLRHLVCR